MHDTNGLTGCNALSPWPRRELVGTRNIFGHMNVTYKCFDVLVIGIVAIAVRHHPNSDSARTRPPLLAPGYCRTARHCLLIANGDNNGIGSSVLC